MGRNGAKLTVRGLVLLLVLAAVFGAIGYKGIMKVVSREDTRLFTNAMVACDFTGISPKSQAELKGIKVHEGLQVKKGDVLFVLDSAEAERGLKQAEALLTVAKAEEEKVAGGALVQELAAAQAQVFQQKADLDSKVAQRDSVRNTLSSIEKSHKAVLAQLKQYQDTKTGELSEMTVMKQLGASYATKKIDNTQYAVQTELAQQQFQFKSQLEAQIVTLKGQMKSLESGIDAAQAGVDNAQSKLELTSGGPSGKDRTVFFNRVKAAAIAVQKAKAAVQAASVKAPKDGTVVKINVQVGEMALPGTPVLQLGDLNQLYTIALIDETRIREVVVGKKVKIKLASAKDRTFEGTISEVGTSTLEFFDFHPNNTIVKALDKHKVPVRIDFKYEKVRLIPGMHAEIDMQ